ncbi:hypothetical protein PENANT_c042G01252 [Penicillium antarcticum]|uniref:Uncharacterized protein n=1 Tax=Penicillium antarcticum TaxID=416450 RepID=A0A1V6PT32_9EURO|nr:hypothetical protein PENANT_c042G01252 [Penicillium antarcticum]
MPPVGTGHVIFIGTVQEPALLWPIEKINILGFMDSYHGGTIGSIDCSEPYTSIRLSGTVTTFTWLTSPY